MKLCTKSAVCAYDFLRAPFKAASEALSLIHVSPLQAPRPRLQNPEASEIECLEVLGFIRVSSNSQQGPPPSWPSLDILSTEGIPGAACPSRISSKWARALPRTSKAGSGSLPYGFFPAFFCIAAAVIGAATVNVYYGQLTGCCCCLTVLLLSLAD